MTIYVNGVFTQGLFYSKTNNSTNIKNKSTKVSQNIYPNPTEGQFTINSLKIGDQIHIYNALGQIILSTTASNNIENFNIIQKGLYYILIKSEDKILTHKLLIQ